MAATFRYSQWDGTQEVFPLNEDALMDDLSDQLLSHGDVTAALRNIVRRGLEDSGRKTKGVQDLLEELRSRKQKSLDKYDLSSVLDDIKNKLASILEHEQEGIERQLERARGLQHQAGSDRDTDLDPETIQKLLKDLERRAASSQEFMQGVPGDDLARAIDQLRNYEFMDPRAKEEFDELLQMLQQRAADSFFKDLSQALQNISPDQMQALKQMLRDLNEMLEQKMLGEDPDFQQFMEKYGPLFGPDPPTDLDELIDQMQHRMAQMQSLLNSMSPEQRQGLQDLLSSAISDPELQQELAQLAANMEEFDPMGSLRQEYPFAGTEELDLSDACR